MPIDPTVLEIVLVGLVSLVILVQVWQQTQHEGPRLERIERKLDTILKAMNIATPNPWDGMDEEWKRIAAEPNRKIEAIKRLREQTGLGLAEAKAAVEDYQRSLSGNNA